MATWTIRRVQVFDGSGASGFVGDVTIDGREILAVSPHDSHAAFEDDDLDGDGLALSPGFIDLHSHSDLQLWVDGRAYSKVSQGITTEVIGQCGISGAPLFGHMADEIGRFFDRYQMDVPYRSMAEYLDGLDGHTSLNVMALIGHGTLRRGIVGEGDRRPTSEDMARMLDAVREGMEAGAVGLSTGLIYPPGCYTETDEVIALAEAMKPYGGLYFTHMRSEGDQLEEAVEEALTIGEKAGVGVQISHHKAMGPHNWGKTQRTLRMVDEAIARGHDVFLDQYPYLASATALSALLPDWALIGGRQETLKRFQDPGLLRRIKEETEVKESRFGWDRSRVALGRFDHLGDIDGLSLQDIAEKWDMPPVDALIRVLQETELECGMVRFGMGEEDVERVIRYPRTLIGTDAGAVAPYGPLSQGNPHPRAYGTFPRVLREFVREHGYLSFEEALHRMTGMAAHRLGLADRGYIKPGYVADLVLLNPETVGDRATFEHAHQAAQGIVKVFVAGTEVWNGTDVTGALPGRVLRHRGSSNRHLRS